MSKWALVLLLLVCAIGTQAQNTVRLIIQRGDSREPIASATVVAQGRGYTSNDSGFVILTGIPMGRQRFSISHIGFVPVSIIVSLPDTAIRIVSLTPNDDSLETVTIVASTRTNQRIENSPLKVEVLGVDDMNEENTIKPGNIASILGDVSGIQIQQSSAVSGNANVRIQGLDGRYTQIVRDGLPLFEGFSGGFGILTIPPLDLRQIELIKGSASTLYGGGAIGGLINLISKKPGYQPEGSLTLNHSTLKESNINTYIASRNRHIGFTFFGGVTHQKAVDVNNDGLSDLAKDDAVILHPRLFVYPSDHTTIALGYTGTFDKRLGGDLQVIESKPDRLHQFFEENNTNRNTVDIVFDHQLADQNRLQVKTSISGFGRSINTNSHRFRARQVNYFTEASMLIPKEKYSMVLGINAVGDKFEKISGDPVLLNDFSNNTLGAFGQYTRQLPVNTTLELGLRGDHHTQYGNFILPRAAVFHRFNDQWATRLGVGFGYKAPNPLAPQNVEPDIESIMPLPADIRAERSVGYNAEVNFKHEFSEHSSVFINHAFFLTRINDPVIGILSADTIVHFINAGESISSKGFDTYMQWQLNHWELYVGYTFTIARRNYLPVNSFMPLTPKNRFAFVLVYEPAEQWRFGLEGSYSGRQYRDNDTRTPGYLFMAGVAERKIGNLFSIVLNCENLLDYRQSKHEALYTGSILNPSFKPLWAPIDGRVVNLSVRWNFLRAEHDK